jgi:hypothetical protein
MAIDSTVVAFAIWLISHVISVDREITEELRAKVVEIAKKCPVHRTLGVFGCRRHVCGHWQRKRNRASHRSRVAGMERFGEVRH